MDFTYFYKRKLFKGEELNSLPEYDLFISCYNKSDRFKGVIENIKAKQKHVLLLPDYHNETITIKDVNFISKLDIESEESELIVRYFEEGKIASGMRICVDITGFFVPHLLFLIKYFHLKGITKFDTIYAEPNSYNEKERTVFSTDFHQVRQIQGYEGTHVPDTSNDVLIIGSGYDDSRITDVANNKAKARKIQLFGFPSLQPDMFQENVIKAYKAESAVGGESFIDPSKNIYAPANDPFVAAQMISEFIDKQNKKKKITNLYFSPISTKVHALGFALYYLWVKDAPVSIIFPFCQQHFSDTSKGVGKILIYSIELPTA